MTFDEITRQNARQRAEQSVKKYFEEAIREDKKKLFWKIANEQFKSKVDDINELKKDIESSEIDIQKYSLSCSLFESMSKELVRLVGVRMIGK